MYDCLKLTGLGAAQSGLVYPQAELELLLALIGALLKRLCCFRRLQDNRVLLVSSNQESFESARYRYHS